MSSRGPAWRRVDASRRENIHAPRWAGSPRPGRRRAAPSPDVTISGRPSGWRPRCHAVRAPGPAVTATPPARPGPCARRAGRRARQRRPGGEPLSPRARTVSLDVREPSPCVPATSRPIVGATLDGRWLSARCSSSGGGGSTRSGRAARSGDETLIEGLRHVTTPGADHHRSGDRGSVTGPFANDKTRFARDRTRRTAPSRRSGGSGGGAFGIWTPTISRRYPSAQVSTDRWSLPSDREDPCVLRWAAAEGPAGLAAGLQLAHGLHHRGWRVGVVMHQLPSVTVSAVDVRHAPIDVHAFSAEGDVTLFDARFPRDVAGDDQELVVESDSAALRCRCDTVERCALVVPAFLTASEGCMVVPFLPCIQTSAMLPLSPSGLSKGAARHLRRDRSGPARPGCR